MTSSALPSIDARIAALVRTPAPALPTEDWDCLFRAVTQRLRQSVDAPAGQMQVIVLDCMQALDQLHAMLAVERLHARLPSLQSLVIERFVKPLLPAERDTAARRFTAACTPAKPRARS